MLEKVNFAIFLSSGFSFTVSGEEAEMESEENLEAKYKQLWRDKLIELLQDPNWYAEWEMIDPIADSYGEIE